MNIPMISAMASNPPRKGGNSADAGQATGFDAMLGGAKPEKAALADKGGNRADGEVGNATAREHASENGLAAKSAKPEAGEAPGTTVKNAVHEALRALSRGRFAAEAVAEQTDTGAGDETVESGLADGEAPGDEEISTQALPETDGEASIPVETVEVEEAPPLKEPFETAGVSEPEPAVEPEPVDATDAEPEAQIPANVDEIDTPETQAQAPVNEQDAIDDAETTDPEADDSTDVETSANPQAAPVPIEPKHAKAAHHAGKKDHGGDDTGEDGAGAGDGEGGRGEKLVGLANAAQRVAEAHDGKPSAEHSNALEAISAAAERAKQRAANGAEQAQADHAQPDAGDFKAELTAADPMGADPIADDAARGVDAASATRTAAAERTAQPTPTMSARAEQIAQDLGLAIARHTRNGQDEFAIRMDPAELGRIHVRLAFDDQGSLRAHIHAESHSVADMLRRDSGELGRVLSDAGVRTDSQSFRFGDGGGNRQMGGQARGEFASANNPGFARDDAALADLTDYRPMRANGGVDIVA